MGRCGSSVSNCGVAPEQLVLFDLPHVNNLFFSFGHPLSYFLLSSEYCFTQTAMDPIISSAPFGEVIRCFALINPSTCDEFLRALSADSKNVVAALRTVHQVPPPRGEHVDNQPIAKVAKSVHVAADSKNAVAALRTVHKVPPPRRELVDNQPIAKVAKSVPKRATSVVASTKNADQDVPTVREPVAKKQRISDQLDKVFSDSDEMMKKLAVCQKTSGSAINFLTSSMIGTRAAAISSLLSQMHDEIEDVSRTLSKDASLAACNAGIRLLFENDCTVDLKVLSTLSRFSIYADLGFAHACMLELNRLEGDRTQPDAKLLDGDAADLRRGSLKSRLYHAMEALDIMWPDGVSTAEHLYLYARAGALFEEYPALRFVAGASIKELGKIAPRVIEAVNANKSLKCLLKHPVPLVSPENTSLLPNASRFTTMVSDCWHPTGIRVPCQMRSAGCAVDGSLRAGPCLVCSKETIWFPGYCAHCAAVTFGLRVQFVSPSVGYGVFATRTLQPNFFLRYEGLILDDAQLRSLYGQQAYYGASVDGLNVVADEFRSLASMINHSDGSEANMRIEFSSGSIIISCIETIYPGCELRYEYCTGECPMYARLFEDNLGRFCTLLTDSEEESTFESDVRALRLEWPVLPSVLFSALVQKNGIWQDKDAFKKSYLECEAKGVMKTIQIEGEKFITLVSND
jgi:hypothetical protein